jgi:hypothetical protein
MNALVPLLSAPGGPLLIPAEQVTGLMRGVAAGWLRSREIGDTDLDPRTVLTLAQVLSELADQLDAECIALMPLRDEQDSGSGDGDGGPPTPQ